MFGVQAVVAVVETGSFTAASERLEISKALLSKYITQVESELGVRLFNRTTRRVWLTEAGQIYYKNAIDVISAYEQMVENTRSEQQGLHGILTISAPFTFGTLTLPPWLTEFKRLHPHLKVQLKLNNRAVNMVEEGIDVRFKVGRLDDSSMIARHLKSDLMCLYASADYLKTFGEPTQLVDLASHQCIIDNNFSQLDYWRLLDSAGQSHLPQLNTTIAVNDSQAGASLAAHSGGIVLLPKSFAEQTCANFNLQPVLSQYHAGEIGWYLIYPHRQYLPAKIARFVEFIRQKF